VGHLPWGHLRTILDKKPSPNQRTWYAAAAVEHGWSISTSAAATSTDLLFDHFRLRSFVVIEPKAGTFDPGYLGQLGIHMAAVDDLMAHPDDKPAIGLLPCRTKNTVVAEWKTPITVSLLKQSESTLPSSELLEAEPGNG
jgi:hypothetical protein